VNITELLSSLFFLTAKTPFERLGIPETLNCKTEWKSRYKCEKFLVNNFQINATE